MTAQDVVSRIQKKLQELGIAWRSQTVDTFKAGAPETTVKAIATSGMATGSDFGGGGAVSASIARSDSASASLAGGGNDPSSMWICALQ